MKITEIEKLQKLRNVDEKKLFETSSQSKKPVHSFGPVCLINSIKNLGLYI
jgi:hypothetical protein